MIHINLNMIFYTHVEHSPTKTIYITYLYKKQQQKTPLLSRTRQIVRLYLCLVFQWFYTTGIKPVFRLYTKMIRFCFLLSVGGGGGGVEEGSGVGGAVKVFHLGGRLMRLECFDLYPC